MTKILKSTDFGIVFIWFFYGKHEEKDLYSI